MKILLTTLFLSVLSFHSRADCPLNTPYEANGTCTACPSGTTLNPYLSPPTCVSGCPTNAPATDDDTGWCSPCPDDKPFASTSTSGATTCTACGEGESYDRYSATCVTVCSPQTSCGNSGGPPRCYSQAEPYMYGTNCYASCPPLTQADSSKTCHPCSGVTLNWNDTNPDPEVQCVQNCPSNKPDNITTPHICTACDITTPYWNHYTEKCVDECVVPYVVTTDYQWCETCIGATGNQYFWDPVNETCVDICPAQLPTFDENNTCVVCNDTIPFFLTDNRSCVETCPSWSVSWNQYNICQPCPIEQPLWIEANHTCNACPSETPYWSNQTLGCVVTCYGSTPSIPDYNETTSWCQICSDPGPYWNNTIHECVSSCPDDAPYTNGSLWCLPCPDSIPVWIDYLSRCNETCPISMPDTNDIDWCVPCDVTTPFYNYTAKECQACPISAPYYDSITYSCVDPCPVPRPNNDTNNWCQACSSGKYWDNFTVPHLCNTTCPRAAPLQNTSTRWCDACSTPTAYYNQTGNTCISSCIPPLPLIGADNWCDPCPSATPYWDPTLSPAARCAATCSPSVPFVDYRNVCVACSNPNPYWNPIDKICVPTCPIAAPFANLSKVCIACQGGKKWNFLSSSCVDNCPAIIPYVNTSNWCSACSSGTHYNSDTSLCVNSCPHPKPFIDSNNWCQPCPNYNPYWDSSVNPGRCVPNCPVSMPNPGLDKWCEDCTPKYWDPITSSCVLICNRPKPAVNTYNWCDFCPTPTPYWDAPVPACVPSCPHERPSTNRDKECQSCPSDIPNWDPDASTCVQTCPPRKPVVGTDNWCEACPSATPYWYSGNDTCVSYCPPVTPSIDDDNWCQPCSGATLKWNPLSSTCVSKCPDSISFWNANAIPAACEVGPDIGDIVQYLETAGMVSTITLAGLQLAWPGIPYVALTILLVNILKYIRYLDINYPPETAKMFQNDRLNVPSLNFGPLFPESWKISTLGHPAPARFAQYDISGLFVANFWRGITTALILAFGVGVLKAFLAKKIANEKAILVREKAKAFLIWNYIYSFFISNVGNIVLFIFIEYHSLYLYDVMGTISFILTIVFGQISLLIVVAMIKSIKGVYKARKNGVKEQMKPEITESFKVLLQKYKDDHLQQMLFIPIMCIRAAIAATLVAAPHAPVAQCSLLVALNIISLAYHIKNRPHRELVDNVQLIAFETTLLIADFACLYLSTLPWDEQYKAVGAGRVIIACNILIFILAFLFILTRVIIAAIRLFKEKFIAKRPGKGVYVQTDVTGSEIDPSTVQLERMESSNKSRITSSKKGSISHKENRLLSISFASSANLDVGTEEDQSPAMKDTKNLNSNNLGTFNVIRVAGDDEREQMSNYFENQE